MTYKPLPECVTIRDSGIHGLGLFATESIPEGTTIGETHYTSMAHEDGYVRTPLGGFINHSDKPNCHKFLCGKSFYLVTLQDIEPGEELAVKYTFYEVGEDE